MRVNDSLVITQIGEKMVRKVTVGAIPSFVWTRLSLNLRLKLTESSLK